MGRLFRWLGLGLGVMLVVGALGLASVYVLSQERMDRRYSVTPRLPVLPGDEEAIARGRHVAAIRGCLDCHGENLAGRVFIDAPPVARLAGSNLTGGAGGSGQRLDDAGYVLAIRHGLAADGRPLLFMPAQEFFTLSDADLGDLIAFLKSVPAVDGAPPPNQVGPLGRLLFLLGQVELLPAELLDHDAPPSAAPEAGPTAEYGAYLATGCTGCHGRGYSGGRIPGTPPSWPPAANLTPDPSGLAGWTEADLARALREGLRPDGSPIRTEFMPVASTRHLTEVELAALWAFLRSLPATAAGNR